MTRAEILSYFLASRRDSVLLELVEISHSAFSQVYRRVRNARQGVTVTLETGVQATFSYYPMRISAQSDAADLDNGLRIDFGDLGEILPRELDNVRSQDAMGEKPVVIYRAYRSDNLAAPLLGPLRLEASNFAFKREGASFEATSPYINLNRTGETYNLTRFPTLRGYVK